MIAARQSVHLALDAVRPEFAGLPLDICCFLKGLEDIERECALPARSGKVVLQLALSRVARTVIRLRRGDPHGRRYEPARRGAGFSVESA